ncbi:hypothetical protein C8J56DRAFT_908953 [Mycena floridula]|nr:hypothetical protein C8J56DRAFT_908953 [Mycena floridula]
MGTITVVNNTSAEIYVSVTATGDDFGKGGGEGWYTVAAKQSDIWGSRNHWQVVRFTRSQTPGAVVESVLGIPGKSVIIN